MPIPRLVKRGVKNILASQGYRLSRIQARPPTAGPESASGAQTPLNFDRSTMRWAIQSLARRLPSVATIFDLGASDGSWSQLAMEYFPRCEYLLIEAQPVHDEALQRFCSQHPNARYVLAAAGAAVGQIYFHAGKPLGGKAAYTPFPEHNLVVPVTTVDEQAQDKKLSGPFLLKLDTHGFEMPILSGAAETLANSAAIVMECYNFKIGTDCVEFVDMCAWLREQGFRCIDIVDLLRRPRDDAFWQMDMVFVRADRPEFDSRAYR